MHLFTTIKIVPATYGRNHNCHRNVVLRYEPVFQTVMSINKLDEIKDSVTQIYGPGVRINQKTDGDEALVTLTYSLDYFKEMKKTIQDLVSQVDNHMRSALADYVRMSVRC